MANDLYVAYLLVLIAFVALAFIRLAALEARCKKLEQQTTKAPSDANL